MSDEQLAPGDDARLALVHDVARPSLDVRDEMMTMAALAGFELPTLAGFTLVAWNRDGQPAVYTDLGSTINPVPPHLLPAFAFSALQRWLASMDDDTPATPA